VIPGFWAGATQQVFGQSEVYFFCVALTLTAASILHLLSWVQGVPSRPRLTLALVVLQAIVTLPALRPFGGIREASFFTYGILAVLVGQLVVARFRHGTRDTSRFGTTPRLAFLASLLFFVPESLQMLGFGSLTGGWVTCSAGIVCVVMTFTVVYSVEFFRTHLRASALQHALEDRVRLLERKTQEVQTLNSDLRRQLETNTTELAQALLCASQSRRIQPLAEGDLIDGKYRIQSLLGKGGMGSVFEAVRVSTGQTFALKIILGQHDPVSLARLAREALSALRVESTRVIAVRDVGSTHHGQLYILMDIVNGPPLSKFRKRFGDIPWALAMLHPIAAGLADIHQAGVIHRDMKPSNVLLQFDTENEFPRALISDFGISSLLSPNEEEGAATVANLTRTGVMLGTPTYMSPESHGAQTQVGPAADVFSFGVLARELLGDNPCAYPVPLGLLVATMPNEPVSPIAARFPEIPASLGALLDTCLQADPDRRPTASELEVALRPFRHSVAPPLVA
jgi:serine/threonine-protein kinase